MPPEDGPARRRLPWAWRDGRRECGSRDDASVSVAVHARPTPSTEHRAPSTEHRAQIVGAESRLEGNTVAGSEGELSTRVEHASEVRLRNWRRNVQSNHQDHLGDNGSPSADVDRDHDVDRRGRCHPSSNAIPVRTGLLPSARQHAQDSEPCDRCVHLDRFRI